ncbi:MAG: amidase family protein [Chloroflexi bacterium]|nr:amidase family protein [Chloroflexota bacterium]MCL5108087.1 amidase family protein [Chloroflexota bacterium]
MATRELATLPISALGRLLATREVSPVEVIDSVLSRTERLEPRLNCYVTLLGDAARAAARMAEREIGAGNYRGPLHGIPVALKDIFDVAGVKTTASSKILADSVATADSTVARLLQDAGAIIVGKTNLHEFAFGVTTNNPHYGPTRNPWDTTRVPGGSSGGSGAAVAASLCSAATGTDTGGSIRIPASLCGIVGLKPTFGRVSKAGVVPLSWTLDHMGPLSKSVEDAAIFLQAIAGYDAADPTTVRRPVPNYRQAVGLGVRGLRLGVPKQHFFSGLQEDVQRAVRAAIDHFASLGVAVEEVSLPHADYINPAFAPIIHAEAAAYHERWLLERPQDYGKETRARLEVGLTVLGTQYVNAQRARAVIRGDFEQALTQVDALITPTIPAVAMPIGADSITIDGESKELRSVYNRLTSPVNLVGLPAVSLPCGFSGEGLPIGLQLIGGAFGEETLITLGHAYETTTDWHQRQPPL